MTKALVGLAAFLLIAGIFWLIGLQAIYTVVAFNMLLVATVVSYFWNWPEFPSKDFKKLKRELSQDIKRFERTGKMDK